MLDLQEARRRADELLEAPKGHLLHLTRPVALQRIFAEGIFSRTFAERRERGQAAKVLLPTGETPVTQEEAGTEKYISTIDSSLVPQERWREYVLAPDAIQVILTPALRRKDASKIPGVQHAWSGEAFVPLRIAPREIRGILVGRERGRLSLYAPIERFFAEPAKGYFLLNSRTLEVRKTLLDIIWSVRTVEISSLEPSVRAALPTELELKETGREISEAALAVREPALEARCPTLRTVRDAVQQLERYAEDHWDQTVKILKNPQLNKKVKQDAVRSYNKRIERLLRDIETASQSAVKPSLDAQFGADTAQWSFQDFATALGQMYGIPVYATSPDSKPGLGDGKIEVLWPRGGGAPEHS